MTTTTIPTLTATQILILLLCSEGWTQKGIADKMGIPFGTLRLHIDRINNKLESKSITQSVAIAVRLKVI